MKQFPLLSQQELEQLENALYFLKVSDLEHSCTRLALSDRGKKAQLIERIITFIKTGTKLELQGIPAQSLEKNYQPQPLSPKSLMLYGSYKNDLQTRLLFKKLIGPYFHFTAFGIDWLEERWHAGNPPTYQEFADFWVQETERRKKQKAEPKKEWAYINFLQQMGAEKPEASAQELRHAWKKMQVNQANSASLLLQKVLKKL